MRRIFLSIAALFATAFVLSTTATAADNTAAILERQTQEIMDAITYGKAEVWERYMDPNALYTDESGNIITKSQMVNDTKPLPAGVSGNIKVTEFKAVVQGSTAIATHLDDEHENYHGHELHCQYRTTDTWIKTPQGWRLLGGQILAVRTDPPSIQLTPQQMEEYVGRYALTPDIVYEIRKKDGALEGQQTGRKPEPIRAEIADMLFVPDKVRYRKVFLRGADGHITGFAERREAWDLVYEIRKKDGALEGQQTGRKPEPIRAEIADMLFVPDKVRYRKVFLRGAGGHITGFAERREAWDLVWKRLP